MEVAVLGTRGNRPALFALLVSSLLVACEEQAPDATFVIDVERIEAPAALPPGAFEIQLHGVIGPDLCFVFDHYETERTPNRIEITAIGRSHRRAERVCAQAISELRGEPPVVVTPPFQGPFTVSVHRPDGSTLEVEIPSAP
jgi:hypothetical protein